jgi:hypothetical protein
VSISDFSCEFIRKKREQVERKIFEKYERKTETEKKIMNDANTLINEN